eukprot:CAMPEP_0194400088 /NCGR_PEP_ID=MMETSP0174-20130528/127015_1 /TAXON_ID=216777 /ORGANISM="Proboscia alata, Strain PI-D3" /LENGTH=1084 /DNA_ID=CAMNT_0039196557 /DNA_START=293 /DNA_END=3547 /DNA_ORIENTATION=+
MDPSIHKFDFIEDDSNETVNDASCITIKPNFHFSSIYLTSRTTEQNGDDDGHKQPFSKYTGKLSNFAWNSILHSCSCSRKLTSIPSNGRMRVFYKTEKDRSDAIRIFEDVINEMTSAVRAAGDFFKQDQDSTKNLVFDHKVASHVLDVWEMEDSSISLINHYAPNYFGLEICERIFWELGLARMRFLKDQFACWASSFARLDPRARIHKFFNMAAQHGDSISNRSMRGSYHLKVSPLWGFNLASVFTVWRPTSTIAIRRMIEGTGVGKGMDISGKTAKLGCLSGYVPFWQVSPQSIRDINTSSFDKYTKVRIFYANEDARKNAIAKLERVRKEMIEGLKKIEVTNSSDADNSEVLVKKRHSSSWDEGNLRMNALCKALSTRSVLDASVSEMAVKKRHLWDMGNSKDSQIILVDDYTSKGIFGIEISEKLMWEGYINQIECYRLKHSSFDPESDTKQKHCHRNNFAETLMAFMMDETIANKDEALKWSNNECRNAVFPWSLVLVDRTKIEELVLKSKHFKTNHFTRKDDYIRVYDSFVTELRNAGFFEETTGEGFAQFWHSLFQKDHPEKCVLVGSEHDTGRPSTFSWQESNLESLRNRNNKRKRRVVLWSQPDSCNPLGLCPYNLLMAYEENDLVVPVVSDFDCFLVGTKRIPIKSLPKPQFEMMKKCVTRCEDILDRKESGSFGDQWDITGGKLPGIGWGDCKTKALMSTAIEYLERRDGCVRHSAECFNYVKPCDMDNEFLIVFEPGVKRKVRWELANEKELVSFLSHQINQGFTFPLNPKWVTCNTMLWKPLYDQLLTSKEPNIKRSQAVWFPIKIRKKIKKIHSKHKNGFSSYHGVSCSTLEIKARYSLKTKFSLIHRHTADDSKGHDRKMSLILQQGNITQFSYTPWEKSAIVVAMNETCEINMNGVGKAVFDAGYPQLERQVQDPDILPTLSKDMFRSIRCPVGGAKRITLEGKKPFGKLKVKHVILAVGPDYSTSKSEKDIGRKDYILQSAYHSSLRLAKLAKLECVAFSLLSAGNRVHHSDPNRPLRIAIKSICEFEDFGSLKEIHICTYTKDQREVLEAIIRELTQDEKYSFLED